MPVIARVREAVQALGYERGSMIGVAAGVTDLEIAEEFFELFKTPWERVVPERRYHVVLSTEGRIENLNADLIVVYSSREEAADRDAGVAVTSVDGPVDIDWEGSTFPIYGGVATFDQEDSAGMLTCAGKGLDYCRRSAAGTVRRIGYDLFREVRHLLTSGQPASQASTPTLELHIALLRKLLLESRVAFVEIVPRPFGRDFICCLTHDLDFFGVRRHVFDRTLAGFVARASVGTLADLVRGRRPLAEAIRNWLALLSLPLVFLRLAPDFWRPFDDYARVENGRRSTFFVVPFKGRRSVAPDGTVDSRRAVPYEASEIRGEITQAMVRGSEIAVHGIDAWRDTEAARVEKGELTSAAGRIPIGVRMHWLYFAEDAGQRLEAAGFQYDSTWGYNDAVGYRAGTSQVFRLPATKSFMELPLSIMDSALFYRHRMGLARNEAQQRCMRIVANARRFGGTLVINWHDRSLAPERLWGQAYAELLTAVDHGDRTWFATATEAVGWFRWRRSVRFTEEPGSNVVTVTAAWPDAASPAGVVRVYRPDREPDVDAEELLFDGRTPLRLEL